jgi:YegS/Rv2252/BmrU family lipid kinase
MALSDDRSKVIFIVNPAAANGRIGADWQSIESAIKEHYTTAFDFEFTSKRMDAVDIARSAIRSGYDVIVSVGGDGTANEVMNGFFDGDSPVSEEARLGLLSLGTGSDLVKTLGLPRNLRSYLRTLNEGRTKRVDVVKSTFSLESGGRASRYFLNVGEFGSGGAVVEKVNRTTKAFGGRVSFLWGIFSTLPFYRNKWITFKVDDGEEVTALLNNFIVANGRYFGGGLKPAPEALMDDGFVDIVTMGDIHFREVLLNIKKLMDGTHLTNPKVKLVRGKRVVASSEEKVLIDEDGEMVGVLPAEFEVHPKALKLIC